MPPKRKTLSTQPQRSSERLRIKMSKNDAVAAAIDLSTPTPPLEKKIPNNNKKKKEAAITSPVVGPADETPIRHIVCVQQEDDVKRFDEAEDCFILGFNPMEKVVALRSRGGGGDSPDVVVVAERGQVACRDFPHSRHLCIKFPFRSTPHENHCELCYCYVCDTAAPCLLWSLPSSNAHLSHCHASEKTGDWNHERLLRRGLLPAAKK